MIIAFENKKREGWWDWFISNPRHCFIVIKADKKLFKLEYTFNGIYITELTEEDKYYYYDIPIKIGKYRFILTCSQFCSSMLGIKGFCLTPKQLERKINYGKYV